MSKKVSIITISYNSEKTIERTLQSILLQKYRPLEYILVDGGSKDGTIKLIKQYIPVFEQAGIEVNFKSAPDRGISDAFNKGIMRSTGEIIGIINSDDRLEENAVQNITEAFDEETDVVCGDCLWIDEEHDLQYVRKSKLTLDKLKYEMVLMHPTCFVRKRAYEKYGCFDVGLQFVMDKELMARFHREGAKVKYIPSIITIMLSGGASDANAEQVFKEGIEVAVMNGIPRWRAILRAWFKMIRLKIIFLCKRKKKIWNRIHRTLP